MPFKMAASVAPNTTLPATRNNTEIFNTTSTLLVTTATTTINTLANYTSSLTNTRSNLSTTHKPIFTDAQSSDCQSFEYDFHKNIPVSAVCGFCFIIGIMLVFVGYRAFRVSMFIMGVSFTSLVTYLILINQTKLGLTWTSSIAGGAGLFFGLLAASVPMIGLIVASIIQGFFATIIVLFIVTIFFVNNQHILWICAGSFGGLSLIFTIIVIAKQRATAIVYITSYGAILIMLSVDYFLDLFLIAKYAYDLVLRVDGRKPCWFSWTVFAMWPFLVILGCCVQFLKTAKGYYHSPAVQTKAKQNKYKTDSTGRSRRLYDNGDVIAQVRSEECLLSDRPASGSEHRMNLAIVHNSMDSRGKAWIQTAEDTLDKRRSFTPVYDYESPDDKESTTLV
eukprot:Seg93.10 transcript_id=Seg93.10/GoldUCD/mRNA.D3Y31 product="Transmembrane protein 198" protein_id=Seg93.10/GoldUCD/D3Y31